MLSQSIKSTMLFFLAIGTASAADLPSRRIPSVIPLPVPAYSWTGLYFGGNVGGAFTDRDTVQNNPNDVVTASSNHERYCRHVLSTAEERRRGGRSNRLQLPNPVERDVAVERSRPSGARRRDRARRHRRRRRGRRGIHRSRAQQRIRRRVPGHQPLSPASRLHRHRAGSLGLRLRSRLDLRHRRLRLRRNPIRSVDRRRQRQQPAHLERQSQRDADRLCRRWWRRIRHRDGRPAQPVPYRFGDGPRRVPALRSGDPLG